MVRDTLTTTNAANKQSQQQQRVSIPETKDSFTISQKDLSNIIETIKANNITDISSINDIVSNKDTAKNFNISSLADHQLATLLSAVRNNIANNIAEVIYNTKQNDKSLNISTNERNHIEKILSSIRQSQVTNIDQAIDIVRSHSSDNPNLISKISGRLVNLIQSNKDTQGISVLRNDVFNPSSVMDPNKFTNPFKSTAETRSMQPKTVGESKEFFREMLTSNQQRDNSLMTTNNTINMSNIMLSEYLRGKNPNEVANSLNKTGIQKMAIEDQVWYQNQIEHNKISFINNIAAKIAADKAKVIITCRLIGQIGGSAIGALGMASVAGASPLIGIVGAFVLTLAAAVAGFAAGKAMGDSVGKTITNTSLELKTAEEYEAYEKEVERLEDERNRQNKKDNNQSEETEDEEDTETEESENITFSKNFFNEIDTKVSNALRTKTLYKKKEK
ncbi:MAG: hypothetical protein AB7V50_01325 [Vampirovibrionia bacterium]